MTRCCAVPDHDHKNNTSHLKFNTFHKMLFGPIIVSNALGDILMDDAEKYVNNECLVEVPQRKKVKRTPVMQALSLERSL